ncbi:methyltransferase [Listeria floridensis FSL S10-1187]|uniref:Methyltransferase n=1 Tax=Listeria floridensis FSL S10-1187 TaxID=1265817 RepID=A0ABP3AXA8_9LIST|nr:methyltransferase domain-containing protein [Listeria floridensis]EUJ31008.1 methyltransferase [Listeria floridensis FSL S10-1187]
MTDNVFEKMADRYDTAERKQLASVIAERIKQELTGSKDKILLDYGSGTGLVGLELAGLANKTILADSSPNMVAVLDKKIAAAGISNTQSLLADFMESPANLQADIIIVSLVLLHIPDTKKILKRLYDALNVGGRLIVVDFEENPKVSHPKVHNGFDLEKLKALFLETGFHSTTIQTFYHGEKVFMNQDADLFVAVVDK